MNSSSPNSLADSFGRPLRSLRVSVTDRCNLRCHYCMPQEEYAWLPREALLSFEEIARLVRIFTGLGVEDIRITGGEPLLRRELPTLVALLAGNALVRDLAMTTNGVLLAESAQALADAGLGRVTVSLDTLRPERFQQLTRREGHAAVLAGIEAVRRAGFTETKLDTVVVRGVNDDELAELIEFGKRAAAEVRFIEYMDVGGAMEWAMGKVVTRAEIIERLARECGGVTPLGENGAAPAQRFRLADGTVFGIIASTTTPFCRRCDRSRLTADGVWYLCLYAANGIDLRGPLRSGASDSEISALIAAAWSGRSDRGAEMRLTERHRGVFIPLEKLRQDTHLEMHTRGG